VPVDGRAEVVHDPLADLVREERLPDAEGARADRDRDHASHESREERVVALGERGVEDLAEQEGRDDPEPGRDEDQAEDRAQAPAVRTEKANDPPRVRAPNRLVRRTLGRLGKRIEASHVLNGIVAPHLQKI
jgi:hypothetical protein